MIAHDPSLVILSITIAVLGAFTACVMTSNILALPQSEGRIRVVMSAVTLGGSIWATHFVGLLALEIPVNFAFNPALLLLSAVIAFAGTAIALFMLWPEKSGSDSRMPAAVAVFGLTLAGSHYAGLAAVAGRGLQLSWFLTLICIAVSIQASLIALWFLFRARGVFVTLAGAAALGLSLSATHYVAIASALGLEQTLLTVPQATSGVSERYLAWSATIMMYLICSICLCVFVIMQFRDEIE